MLLYVIRSEDLLFKREDMKIIIIYYYNNNYKTKKSFLSLLVLDCLDIFMPFTVIRQHSKTSALQESKQNKNKSLLILINNK